VKRPQALLRRRGRSHAPHPRRGGPAEDKGEAGGDLKHGDLDAAEPAASPEPDEAIDSVVDETDLLALSEALDQLETESPRGGPNW
jgi:hypothetical protein